MNSRAAARSIAASPGGVLGGPERGDLVPYRNASEPRVHVREASMQIMLDKDFGSNRGGGLGSGSPGSDPLKE